MWHVLPLTESLRKDGGRSLQGEDYAAKRGVELYVRIGGGVDGGPGISRAAHACHPSDRGEVSLLDSHDMD